MDYLLFMTISGPCWDHVWLCFTSTPARALEFLKLSQNGLRPISWSVYFLDPCQGHFWTVFSPNLLQDQLNTLDIQN